MLAITCSLALVPLAAPAPPVAQLAPRWSRVAQPNVVRLASLGIGLALDDTTMIAGAPHAVAGAEEELFDPLEVGAPGSITVYERANPSAAWQETQFIRPSLSFERDRFGVSIVLDGDTAFVGAPSTVVGGLRTGAVYRFERVGGVWVERQILASSRSHHFAGFGNHLAFDGTQLIVGAPFQDGAGINEWGHGFVFERSAGGDWVETGVLEPPPMPDKSWAGYRVAIDGDQAALGLFGFEGGGNGAGAICRFEHTAQGWVPVEQVLPSVEVPFSHFSYELILDGDLLISGAYRSGPAGHHHGSVNVFRRDPAGGFVEVQRIVPPGLEYGAVMGVSAAMLDDGRLAAGIAGADGQRGRVGIYSPRPDGTFRLDAIEYAPHLRPGASFGWKVATDGTRIATSAPLEVIDGEMRGAVYVWDPDEVSFERPYCAPSNVTNNPRPVLLRSRGALDEGSPGVRLSVTELVPQAVVTLLASPATSSGPAIGCLRGPIRRVVQGPPTSDPNGGCTWWIGGTELASACTVGTTWTFQVFARVGSQRVRSNALELTLR